MAATTVTEYLIQFIAKQVDEKGLVVGYDPEQAYSVLVQEWLALPAAHRSLPAAAFDDNFLKLRKAIDHLMGDGA